MGFFGLIKSIEDLLYEVITWLVFYPRTLWRVIRHPLAMTAYSENEQGDAADEQYTDTLSPPLFLMLSILIGHTAESAAGVPVEQAKTALAKLLYSSEEMRLLFSSIVFSLFPLMYALAYLKRSALEIDRKTLRGPFFSQCYMGAVLALAMSAFTVMARNSDVHMMMGALALALLLLAVIAYIAVQAIWLKRHLALSPWRAGLLSTGTFGKTLLLLMIATPLLSS